MYTRVSTSAAVKSNMKEDYNQNISCIQEVLKTKTIARENQIHHREVLPYAMR